MSDAKRALDEWDRVADLYSSDARLAFLRGYAAATAASDALLLAAVRLALAEAANVSEAVLFEAGTRTRGGITTADRIRAIPPQPIVDRAKEAK